MEGWWIKFERSGYKHEHVADSGKTKYEVLQKQEYFNWGCRIPYIFSGIYNAGGWCGIPAGTICFY